MKIIHHEYRSHPTLASYADRELIAQKDTLVKTLRVALGRLTVWQHIEIKGIKLDGLTPHDIVDLVKAIFYDDPMYPNVIRRERNRVRVWRVPQGNWQKRARQSLEFGADSSEGIIEYITASKTPAVLREITQGTP